MPPSLPFRARRVLPSIVLIASCGTASLPAGEYFEGFDTAGQPAHRDGITWDYTAELSPVRTWNDLIPGDGYAHLTVERGNLRRVYDQSGFWPFQTISLGPVGSNHRISIRARNTVIPGVACELFTFREGVKLDEIDIEIVADDLQGSQPGHPTGPEGGWTDVRLNTWADARGSPPRPAHSLHQPVRGAGGNALSLRDTGFHTYTIEWTPRVVRFYIDGVFQGAIDDVVPDHPSRIIFGMRRMPWAGEPDWTGSRTMLADWVDIEELGDSTPEREGNPPPAAIKSKQLD